MSNPHPTPPPLEIPGWTPEVQAEFATFADEVWAVFAAHAPVVLSALSALNLKGEQFFVAEATAQNTYLGMLASALGGLMIRILGQNESSIVNAVVAYVHAWLLSKETPAA